MDINDMPENLFNLLSCKNYEDLSSKEKEMVEQFMSMQDYLDLHIVVNRFRQADSEVKLRPTELDLPQKRPSALYKLLIYRIPIYKIAASFLLLIGIFFAINNLRKDFTAPENVFENKNTGIPINKDNYPDDLVFEL